MNKTISIVRITLLNILVAVSVICIFSEPVAGENWLMWLIVTKVLGFGCAIYAIVYGKKWKNDYYVQKLNKWIDKE